MYKRTKLIYHLKHFPHAMFLCDRALSIQDRMFLKKVANITYKPQVFKRYPQNRSARQSGCQLRDPHAPYHLLAPTESQTPNDRSCAHALSLC